MVNQVSCLNVNLFFDGLNIRSIPKLFVKLILIAVTAASVCLGPPVYSNKKDYGYVSRILFFANEIDPSRIAIIPGPRTAES
jgi:hypothetical protein